MGTGATNGRPSHSIAWFRRDLRLGENPVWAAATQQSDTVTALFVLDPKLFDSAGPFRRRLLCAHLHALDAQLRARGGRLRIEHGAPKPVLRNLVAELHVDNVHFNADTTPYAVARDTAIRSAIGDITVSHWGTLVHEPGRVLTQKRTLSRVFTPFWKVWERSERSPWVEGEGNATVLSDPGSGLPAVAGHAALDDTFAEGGEVGAHRRLHDFLERVDDYLDLRDRPAEVGTSLLSADLRFGTLSPREVIDIVGDSTAGRRGFVRQLAWRDWYAHLLYENPAMPHAAIKPQYDAIAWRNDPDDFKAWKQGQTGYPIVDAGMRQLAATGFMHNRVRMIVGSFLVKDLLVDWRLGERWFRHLLADADMSQNVGNWQWVAGCGTDAAPYFRVFNPWLQSRKFDRDGEYIRHWVPELAMLTGKQIHEPASVAPLDLAAAGVVIGDTYPAPIVDHAFARDRALQVFKAAVGKDAQQQATS